MSLYPPPSNWIQTIFNPYNFPQPTDTLNITQGDTRYLIKIGSDTDYGNLTLKQNLYFSDSSLAIYKGGTNDLRISIAGIDRILQTSSSTRINQPVLLSDGVLGTPAYAFANETSLGWYRAGAGDIRLSQLGSDALTYSGSQFLVNGRQRTIISGTAANPSIKIGTDDTNMTGFYNNGVFSLTASVGQTAVADFRYTAGAQGIRLFGNTTTGNNALYSASILGYYEENTTSMQFQFAGSGITPAGNVKFVRIGQLVVMSIPQYAEITNNSGGARAYVSTGTIPIRFQPPSLVMTTLIGILNGGNTNTLSCYINAGTIYIERLTALFSNTDRFYPYSFTMSWMLA